MNWLELLLTILTAILGGGNILQLFMIRSLRRKSSAEAYQTEINSLRTIIAGNVEEIQRLTTNYGELQDKYFALAEELQELKRKMAKTSNKTGVKQKKAKS